MRLFFRLLFVLFLFGSCERAIEFKPENPEAKLVVEGVIENGQFPVVYLTKSLSFFDRIDPSELAGSFIRNAVVKISDGQKTTLLKEKEIEISEGVNIYLYTVDTADYGTAIKGEFNTTYDLDIQIGEEKYTSSTTIPALAKTINRLYYEEYIDKEDSGKVALYGEFNDPPGRGNYTRYFTKTNDGEYLPGLNSVFDDQIVDGQTYELQIEQGVDRNSDIDFDEYSFFRRGDDISVKYCNIDKATYDFWRTMEYSYQSIGNPFSSPTRVMGNISNGALGYFGGYAVQYVIINIPD